MEYVDIVDDKDGVIGRASIAEAHQKGLRHRSAQVLVFRREDLQDLLVSQRSKYERFGPLLLQASAGGHVTSGGSYLDCAMSESSEELFGDMPLPAGVSLTRVSTYKNDDNDAGLTNREITALFYAVCPGPFFPSLEIERVYWQNQGEVWKDMQAFPIYTQAFINALGEFRRLKKK